MHRVVVVMVNVALLLPLFLPPLSPLDISCSWRRRLQPRLMVDLATAVILARTLVDIVLENGRPFETKTAKAMPTGARRWPKPAFCNFCLGTSADPTGHRFCSFCLSPVADASGHRFCNFCLGPSADASGHRFSQLLS